MSNLYLHYTTTCIYYFRFHESLWQLQNRPDYKVSREVLMVALQNLQYILVKASDHAEFMTTTCVTKIMHHSKIRNRNYFIH